jgi:hypothetical protein
MLPKKPESASEVLAVVLCPARAFGSGADVAAAARALLPVKAELCRRFQAARAAQRRN